MLHNYIQTIAVGFTTAGIISLLVTLLLKHDLYFALLLTLDFWMGAGFLKLTGSPSWTTITASASIVLIRKILVSTRKTGFPIAKLRSK